MGYSTSAGDSSGEDYRYVIIQFTMEDPQSNSFLRAPQCQTEKERNFDFLIPNLVSCHVL